ALKTIAFLLFDHIGGFNTLMYILSSAGTIVALQSRSPEETCRLIEKYQVELLPTSPSFINMILYSRVYEKYDLSSLKLVTYGTEPMPEATLKKFHSLFPNIKLKQTYGLSELGIMSSKSEGSDSLWLKVGGAGYETKIVDNKLWIMAKSAMLGYLNAPSPFDEEGWFNTGDEVEQKGDYIRFLGRDSEIINVGGEKVYPAEVESVILEVEHVKDAIVYGKQNPLLGHMVCTDITLDSDYLDPSEMKKTIKKHCLERLERYKIPVKINISNKVFANDRFKRIRR
ncbi:MAG TPA: fatty acid--CoA ligase family protein, partial [Bacillota bacterium]|nr:fatty acid--CoA ligase family protein [Bacillota bacterium]